MSDGYTPWRCGPLTDWRAIVIVSWLGLAGWAQAQSLSEPKAHLVTYGQGSEVWEWFGHNALWLQDPDKGLNHTFSFGYFDIEEAGFYLRFIQGDMAYFGTAVQADREFEFYRQANRSIRVQTLNLNRAQFDRLHSLLVGAIEPYPRYYSYDYFLANCSTWLRDLLDDTLDGAVSGQYQALPGERTFRAHTHAQTHHQPWAQLGLMALLGPAANRPIQAWDEAFLPDVLAEQVAKVRLGDQPLVVADEWLYQPDDPLAAEAGSGFWRTPLWGVVFAGLLLWGGARGGWVSGVTRALAVSGLSVGGLVVLGMWLLTAHDVVARNPVVVMLHPVWLGLWPGLPRRVQTIAWGLCVLIMGLGSLGWLVSGAWPHRDVLVFVLPWALAMLWVTRPSGSLGRRGAPAWAGG